MQLEDVEMGIFPADCVGAPESAMLDELDLFEGQRASTAADEFGELADLLGEEDEMMMIGASYGGEEFDV